MPAAVGVLEPPQSKNIIPRVALVPVGSKARPTRATLTNSASPVAVAAEGVPEDVTMTLTADPGTLNMQVGQYLQFKDPAGLKYLTKVRTVFTDGTSLELTSYETIPAGAVAEFPAVIDIRNSFSFDETVTTGSFSSFQHSSATQSIGEGSGSVTADGGHHFMNAGARTIEYAKDNKLKVWLEGEFESPDGNIWATGDATGAIGAVTGITRSGTDGEAVGANYSFSIQEVTRIDPAV